MPTQPAVRSFVSSHYAGRPEPVSMCSCPCIEPMRPTERAGWMFHGVLGPKRSVSAGAPTAAGAPQCRCGRLLQPPQLAS